MRRMTWVVFSVWVKGHLWLSDFIEIHLPVSFTLCGSHRRVRYLSEMKPDIPFFFLSVYSRFYKHRACNVQISTALGKSQLVWFDKELVVSLTHTRSTALHLLILPHLHRLDFHLSLKTCLQQVAFFSRNTLPSKSAEWVCQVLLHGTAFIHSCVNGNSPLKSQY